MGMDDKTQHSDHPQRYSVSDLCFRKIRNMPYTIFLLKLHSLPSIRGKTILEQKKNNQCKELDVRCWQASPQSPADTGARCSNNQLILTTLCSWGCKSTPLFCLKWWKLKEWTSASFCALALLSEAFVFPVMINSSLGEGSGMNHHSTIMGTARQRWLESCSYPRAACGRESSASHTACRVSSLAKGALEGLSFFQSSSSEQDAIEISCSNRSICWESLGRLSLPTPFSNNDMGLVRRKSTIKDSMRIISSLVQVLRTA